MKLTLEQHRAAAADLYGPFPPNLSHDGLRAWMDGRLAQENGATSFDKLISLASKRYIDAGRTAAEARAIVLRALDGYANAHEIRCPTIDEL